MPIVIDPAAAQAAGTRVLLRDMQKANEAEIDQICKDVAQLLREISVDAPQGWKATIDGQVTALKAAVAERKDIKDALQALP